MDKFELVERLVKTTGVSFEDAKNALEASGWDLLDAAVWLEKNGKVENKSASYNSNPAQQQEQENVKQESTRGEYRRERHGSGNHVLSGIIGKVKNILLDNDLVLVKQNGEVFLDIPIWLTAILLIVFTWPFIGVLVLVFVLGFRLRLQGPDLGGAKVNAVLTGIENQLGNLVERMKGHNRPYDDNVIDYDDYNRNNRKE